MHQLAMHRGTGRLTTISAELIKQERLHKDIAFHVNQYGLEANKILHSLHLLYSKVQLCRY